MSDKNLSILFMKDGFSFCVLKKQEVVHAQKVTYGHHDKSLKDILAHELNQHLYLGQTYDKIEICYLGNQFNIIPNSYYEKEKDAQKWLEFSSEIFEGDIVVSDVLSHMDATIVYAYPKELEDIIQAKFNTTKIKSASKIFLDCLEADEDVPQLFLNVHLAQIEISIYSKGSLQLYNIFEASTKEDIVYYVLNCLKQLELDPNIIHLYYFGLQLGSPKLKMLMNFVRHVMPGTSEIWELDYFTEINNIK